MIGTCSMRLFVDFVAGRLHNAKRVPGTVLGTMTVMTVDRHRASRLGLGPGPGSTFLLLTKIRLFLQFLSVQIKKYTTLKR